jgi:hypothetical protein
MITDANQIGALTCPTESGKLMNTISDSFFR